MHILTGQEIFNRNVKRSALTIGNFDGVHRGHMALFDHLKLRAARLALPSLVVTFEPHPLKVMAPEAAPPMITTFEQKISLIAAAGIDYLAVVEFTPQFAATTADDFVRRILCDSFGMQHIVIGHDYAFGRNRQGNYATLDRLGRELEFSLEDMDPVGEGGAVFSSSLARRLISSGAMAEAAAILGRYHVISGRVVHGRDIGRTLGFPTANIETPNELIPPDGIYAVMVGVGDRLHQGACSIGTNPTFDGRTRSIEVFLLDFTGHLYDQQIALCFVQRLRDVKKFPDVPTLVQAIGEDVAQTRTILATVSNDMIQPLLNRQDHEDSP